MPEVHLKQPGFTYLKDLHLQNIACFAHDASNSDSKILLRELFQIRFWKIELMKLLEIVDMMDIKEH